MPNFDEKDQNLTITITEVKDQLRKKNAASKKECLNKRINFCWKLVPNSKATHCLHLDIL